METQEKRDRNFGSLVQLDNENYIDHENWIKSIFSANFEHVSDRSIDFVPELVASISKTYDVRKTNELKANQSNLSLLTQFLKIFIFINSQWCWMIRWNNAHLKYSRRSHTFMDTISDLMKQKNIYIM